MTTHNLVVLDVNVLVSAYLDEGSLPGQVYSACVEGTFGYAMSRGMANKLAEVLARPKFIRYMKTDNPEQVAETILGLAARVVDPDPAVVGVADDLEDDRILGVAVTSGASAVVTGDKGLLALGHFGEIAILTPRQFLAVLAGDVET